MWDVGKVTSDAALDPAGLVAVAVAHAFALFVGVAIAANISGGHLNPAVTFGLAIGGNITILTGLFYWIAQCLGSIVACALLKFVTNGLVNSLLNFILFIFSILIMSPNINKYIYISWYTSFFKLSLEYNLNLILVAPVAYL